MQATSISSPVGDLVLAEDDGAIVAINWRAAAGGNGSPLLAEAARQIEAYFMGELIDFDLPLRPAGSAFERAVWVAIQDIPYGETRCYGDLAATTGSAARAVGQALRPQPDPDRHSLPSRAGQRLDGRL